MMKLSTLTRAIGAAIFALTASHATAQDLNLPVYEKAAFGTSGCNVSFGPLWGGGDLAEIKDTATSQGAYGFVYQPQKDLYNFIIAPFPKDCQPAPTQGEELYLPAGAVLHYSKQDFGFDGCDVPFGPILRDIDLDGLAIEAREINAIGFTKHPTMPMGYLIEGDYPAGCKSGTGGSWPLYLADHWNADYVHQDYGFDGCDVTEGPLLQEVSEQVMKVAAAQHGVDSFTFQPSLKYGKLFTKPYPTGCKSPASGSWPLYLQQ